MHIYIVNTHNTQGTNICHLGYTLLRHDRIIVGRSAKAVSRILILVFTTCFVILKYIQLHRATINHQTIANLTQDNE